jgi:hypothetical protein
MARVNLDEQNQELKDLDMKDWALDCFFECKSISIFYYYFKSLGTNDAATQARNQIKES